MNKNFTVYLPTGEILRTGSCPNLDINLQAGENELVIEGSGCDEGCFVDDGEIKQKQPLNLPQPEPITANGTDEAVITGIPGDVFVTWPDGEREEVTDGVVEFSVTQPGSYSLKFDGVKYLAQEVTIEANPQA